MSRITILTEENSFHSEKCEKVYHWYGCGKDRGVISIPDYVEENAFRIRSKYLHFINEVGQKIIRGRSITDHCTLSKGYNIWWMSTIAEKNLVKSPNISDCLKIFALEEIIESNSVSEILVYSNNKKLADAITLLCRNKNLFCKHVRLNKNNSQKAGYSKIFSKLPDLLQAFIFLSLFLKKKYTFFWKRNVDWFTGDNSLFVLSYFVNIDKSKTNAEGIYSQFWGTLPSLIKEKKICINWIEHFIPCKEIPEPRSALYMVKEVNENKNKQEVHCFLYGYLDIGLIISVTAKFLSFYLKGWQLSRSDKLFSSEHSRVDLSPLLVEDCTSSFCGKLLMENLIWIELLDKSIADLPKQKAGLYLQENTGWERAFLHAWRLYGHGYIVGVAHATVRFWDLRYYDVPKVFEYSGKTINDPVPPRPNSIAVNGPLALENLKASDFPDNEIVKTEALRYLKTIEIAKKETRKNMDFNSTSLVQRKRILLCGDIDYESTMALVKCVEQAVSLLSSEEFEFTFKPHPVCGISIRDFKIPSIRETDIKLSQILNDYDILVAADSTTAALEGFERGLKVILYCYTKRVNFSPLLGIKSVSFVTSANEMASAITNEMAIKVTDTKQFFWSDKTLPQWRTLLNEIGYNEFNN